MMFQCFKLKREIIHSPWKQEVLPKSRYPPSENGRPNSDTVDGISGDGITSDGIKLTSPQGLTGGVPASIPTSVDVDTTQAHYPSKMRGIDACDVTVMVSGRLEKICSTVGCNERVSSSIFSKLF